MITAIGLVKSKIEINRLGCCTVSDSNKQ